MRWLALFLLLTPSISHGVNINDADSISAAIDDPDSFSFFYIGIPLTVYVIFFSDIPHKLITDTTTHTGLGYLLILSIAGTGLALIFFNKLIKISSPVFASSVTYLIPVVAIIWALFDGETFHLLYFICFLLILSGIFLVNASPYRKLNISSWLLFRKKK